MGDVVIRSPDTQYLISLVGSDPTKVFRGKIQWKKLKSGRQKSSPLREFGVCFTGDGVSSLYNEPSSTETGLGCSGATVASSGNNSSSSNLGVGS